MQTMREIVKENVSSKQYVLGHTIKRQALHHQALNLS